MPMLEVFRRCAGAVEVSVLRIAPAIVGAGHAREKSCHADVRSLFAGMACSYKGGPGAADLAHRHETDAGVTSAGSGGAR